MSRKYTKDKEILSKHHKKTRKFQSELCDDGMSFQECEMAILRHSVDESEKQLGKRIANSPEVMKMIHIVEEFLKSKQLVCYGGTAINNILPKSAQFYDKSIEIPDYDFFSPNALSDAKELADIYAKEGYDEVEAKSGVHEGTYKVFVNFIAVADITHLHPTLYASLKKESIHIGGIRYAPPNYLRMGMFLELSRPEGDVSRWEKVLKRMNLLNKHYPLQSDVKCNALDIQRPTKRNPTDSEKLFFLTRDVLMDEGVVFFGGYASSLYSRYMKNGQSSKNIPDFDVLSEDPEKTAKVVAEHLRDNGIRHIRLVQHTGLGEVVPEHIEVIVEKETVVFIYRTIACHSYNTITIDNRQVNIATIDTMLSFYLAFLYANKKYYDKRRILCLSIFLFQLEQQNRLSQKGLLKRFSTKCYGKQETLETIRAKKARQYALLSKNPKSIEFESAFLKYTPNGSTKKAAARSPKSKTRKTVTQSFDILVDTPTSTKDTTKKDPTKKDPTDKEATHDKIDTPNVEEETPNTLEKTLRRRKKQTFKRKRPTRKHRNTPRVVSPTQEQIEEPTEEETLEKSPLNEPMEDSMLKEPEPTPKKTMPIYSSWLSRLRNGNE